MIDQQLLREVREYLRLHSSIVELPDDRARDFVTSLANRYDRSPDTCWWWQGLMPEARIEYGESDPAGHVLTRLSGESSAHLVITDDEPPPWPVLFGSVRELTALVGDQRFFEYILAAPDGGWLIFDTHHNELLFLGDFSAR